MDMLQKLQFVFSDAFTKKRIVPVLHNIHISEDGYNDFTTKKKEKEKKLLIQCA